MITLALVLTPVASAQALAALCALDGLDVDVVPSSRGAIVVRAVGVPGPGSPEPRGSPEDAAGDDAAGDAAGREPSGEAAEPGAAEPGADDAELDWDIAELFDDGTPDEAHQLAARLSLLTKLGVVLLTAQLTEDGAFDTGLSGHIAAKEFVGGEPGEDLAAGLVLAGADDVVEDLLLGRCGVADVRGHVSSREAGPGRRGRWTSKGLRRPRP